MPKRRQRREQQHLRQESSRRRAYQVGGSAPQEIYKPGFPMSVFTNAKAFWIVGGVVAVIMVVGMIWTTAGGNGSASADDIATPSPTPTVDPNATPTPSPTPDPKRFAAAEQVIDPATKDYRAVVKTSMGDFTIALDASRAPNTVNNFVFLAQKDYFDGILFHRVMDNFVIQGGDPAGTGASTYPGYTTADEPNEVRNTRGTVAMAKRPGARDFGSQFFVNLKDNNSLDFDNPTNDKFYPFGSVVSGMDVVDAIAKVPVDANKKPTSPVTITDVVIEVSDK